MAPKRKLDSETLNDYEQQRLDNIRRNGEMMKSLMLQNKASDLASSLKRPLPAPKPKPKPAAQSPVVIRRSPRIRGIPPQPSSADSPASPTSPPTTTSPSPRKRGPLLIREAFIDGPDDSDSGLIGVILSGGSFSDEPRPGPVKKAGSFDPRSELVLRPENAAKVVSERILSVRFLPLVDRTVVAVGNKIGNLGFWDANSLEGDGDGVYVYFPHSAPVSGIAVHPFSPRKIFTSSYDGFIRLMDVEKETFNMILSSEEVFYSICQRPHDDKSLYIGEGGGTVKVWDERAGRASNSWDLHGDRINTIDFNVENLNLMATSSSDRRVCVWDLRSMKESIQEIVWNTKSKKESLKEIVRERAVHGAYFSPSGKYLALTSLDNKVGIAGGADYDNLDLVFHYNQTGRWLSTFRAIWGWDDSYLYIGNMKRAVDVISTIDKTTTPLESPDMTSIPCRFAAHPYMPGHLAGATSGGKVFLWTKE